MSIILTPDFLKKMKPYSTELHGVSLCRFARSQPGVKIIKFGPQSKLCRSLHKSLLKTGEA